MVPCATNAPNPTPMDSGRCAGAGTHDPGGQGPTTPTGRASLDVDDEVVLVVVAAFRGGTRATGRAGARVSHNLGVASHDSWRAPRRARVTAERPRPPAPLLVPVSSTGASRRECAQVRMARVTSQPEGQERTATSGQLTSAVAAQLADLHQRSKITKGQWSGCPARRSASTQLWALVEELHTSAGVSTEKLGAVLGVKPNTVLAQLRHHGFLGGPSASQRLVHQAAGPAQPPGLPGPRLAAAVERTRRARTRLATAKTQLVR